MPLARWLCLLLLACTPLLHASPRIGVMTMAPGEIFFERFGHDAIVVYDEASQSAISYNFGFFDMGEPGFTGNFVRGVMNYSLVALPLEQDLAYYRDVGRGVRIQWLDLRPQQASALADALAENAKPENARYRYDYFTDNCASRVRDALDTALGGALKQQLAPQSHGRTYRSEAVRLASPAPWMWLGFDIGLGPYADRPLSAWDEAFIPMRLAEHLRGARNSDGRPLVLDEVEILPERVAPEPAESARTWWPWLLGGTLLAIGIGLLGMRQPRIVGGLAGLLWLPAGIAGAVLLYLWGFSEHRAAWANHNVLLFNPMCLLLLPAAVALLRGRDIARWLAWLATIVALFAALALVLACLPFTWQDNRAWVALLLPIHAALAWVLHKRRGLPRIRR